MLEDELQYSGTRNQVYNYSFYGIWKKLLLVFAKGESVAFFINPSIVIVLYGIVHNAQQVTPEVLSILAQNCPVLCNLFCAFSQHQIPAYALSMFEQLLAICIKSYPWLYKVDETAKTIELLGNSIAPPKGKIPLEGFAETVCTATIIPEPSPVVSGCNWLWPKIRQGKMYEPYMEPVETPTPRPLQAVNNSSTQQWSTVEDVDSTAECKKVENTKYKEKDQIAGLFVGCCTHTFCYGWHCMFGPEGRKDVMKVLYERLPEKVLDNLVVIYDFGCQAAEYCIKREPVMFARTQFFIDRFHGSNHKCASFWKLMSYPGFSELISTASETLNAFLQRFHSQCAYMRQDTYMLFLEVVITVRNWLINERHRGNNILHTQ